MRSKCSVSACISLRGMRGLGDGRRVAGSWSVSAFVAGVFLVAGFFATDFFAAGCRPADGLAFACAIGFALCAVVFFAVAGFFATGFFATGFFAVDFFATGFVVFFAMIIAPLLSFGQLVLCKSPYGGFFTLRAHR